ncbi:MAG: hypothetical protein JNM74_11860 [Myxococcales bacterium]|jgi:hypothetical protein|nr:hypothetical protein [Myxococcales bacterium]
MFSNLARGLGLLALSTSLVCMGCAADTTTEDPDAIDDATEVGEDALTTAAAQKLGVPLSILDSTFYFKPSPQDQSGLGVVLGEGVAFATGSGSQSLPLMTSLDRKPFVRLHSGQVEVPGSLDDSFGAFFDYTNLRVDGAGGERLLGKKVPPLLEVGAMREGLSCRVLGAAFDMFASTPPKTMSLAGKVTRMRTEVRDGKVVAYQVIVTTTKSSGGDGSLLVCGGKLAGIAAGAGSQGTTYEFRSVDPDLVKAFGAARTAQTSECKRRNRCE